MTAWIGRLAFSGEVSYSGGEGPEPSFVFSASSLLPQQGALRRAGEAFSLPTLCQNLKQNKRIRLTISGPHDMARLGVRKDCKGTAPPLSPTSGKKRWPCSVQQGKILVNEGDLENRIPTRLKKEPLLEALWEVRFIGAPSIADVLPGILFKELEQYEKIVRLPVADIPDAIVKDNLALLYLPKVRLENGNQAVQIGDHAVSLSCRRPYSGWSKFSSDIRKLIAALEKTGLIKTLERFALKYIDLIELDQQPASKCLNLNLKLGRHEINVEPMSLRTDIKEDKLIHAVKIVSPAEAFFPDSEKQHKGVLLDIDTIRNLNGERDWENLEKDLDPAHMASKKMFFSLLSKETVKILEPEYKEE